MTATARPPMTGHADRLVLAARRHYVHHRARWASRHRPRPLPGTFHRAWPHLSYRRSRWVRWPANASRVVPASIWSARSHSQSSTVRLLAAVLFAMTLAVCALMTVAIVAGLLPLRLVVIAVDELQVARGWIRPGACGLEHANALASRRLAEVRLALTDDAAEPGSRPATSPTPPIRLHSSEIDLGPPPAPPRVPVAHPTSLTPPSPPLGPTGALPPWVAPQTSPVVVTLPHYVQIRPPHQSRPRPSPLAVARRGWLAFKVLALGGFAYSLCLGCLIQLGADRLNDTRTDPTPTAQVQP